MRIRTPTQAPEFTTRDIHGQPISSTYFRGNRLMLSFFRDVACPFCNLRVYELSSEYESLSRNGMQIVTFFRSSNAQVRQFVARRPRPFIMVADPDMHVYRPYGIEHSWAGVMRAMMLRIPRLLAGMRLGSPRLMGRDPNLLPADFLIDSFGYVRHAYYGRDLGDHLPIDTVRSFASIR